MTMLHVYAYHWFLLQLQDELLRWSNIAGQLTEKQTYSYNIYDLSIYLCCMAGLRRVKHKRIVIYFEKIMYNAVAIETNFVSLSR